MVAIDNGKAMRCIN